MAALRVLIGVTQRRHGLSTKAVRIRDGGKLKEVFEMKKPWHRRFIPYDPSPNMENCIYNDIESVNVSEFKRAVERFVLTIKRPTLLGCLSKGIDGERMLKVKIVWEKNYGRKEA